MSSRKSALQCSGQRAATKNYSTFFQRIQEMRKNYGKLHLHDAFFTSVAQKRSKSGA